MPTVLALSPHLDDAAFSCGGTLAALAGAGHRTIVATVFTRSVASPQGFALACQLDKGLSADVDYMALRRSEDAEAMRVLGAEPIWLGEPEAPHRGYHSAAELFAGRHEDDEVVATLAPMLRELIARLTPALVLAPQAVGNHVDHHAVRDALAIVCGETPVVFWTDAPYAFRSPPSSDGDSIAVPLSMSTLSRKVEAACKYVSQIGFQFGGAEKLRQALEEQTTERFQTADTTGRLLHTMLPSEAAV